MRNSINIYIGIGLLLHLLGCTGLKGPTTDEREEAFVDSLLLHYKDSVTVRPREVIRVMNEQMLSVHDSLNRYSIMQLISRALFFENQLDSALLINQSVIAYCAGTPRKSKQLNQLAANAYNNQGVFMQEQNKWDTAALYMKKAYEMQLKAKDLSNLPNICINLADCYDQQGRYEWAGFYYRRALSVIDSLRLPDILRYPVYSGLAKLYQELENYPQADTYFKNAEHYWKVATPYEQYFFANSRGNYYYVTNEYEQALHWLKQANQVAATLPQPFYRGIVEGNMGEIFLLMNKVDSARYYLDRARGWFGTSTLKQPGIKFYMDGLYGTLALQEGNLQVAEKLLLQPYDTIQTNLLYQFHHNKRLEKLFLKKGFFNKAYAYRVKADACNDSLRSTKVHNAMMESEFRYNQDTTLLKKDIQLALAKTKEEQWEALTTMITMFLLFILLFIVIIYYNMKKKRAIQYKKQLATVTKLRIAAVRNRIAPHSIFNVLNSVMPAFRRYPELAEPVRLLIEVLRGDLQSSEQIALSLEDEIRFVRNDLQLRLLGNPNRIHIHWMIAPEVKLDTPIPSMSIQIPVENAVKYAFESDSIDASININITVVGSDLSILIEDNGVGYQLGTHIGDEKGTGHGLKILYRTIDLLNSSNSHKIYCSIQNLQVIYGKEHHGTRVSLIVPLKYNYTL